MKRLLLLCTVVFVYATTIAQTHYTMNYAVGAGNPGAVNTDNDAVTTGWTTLIGGSISTNQWSPSTALPFTFNYFGNPVTDFKASSNGLITFSSTTSLPNDNVTIPSSGLTDSTIACFWDAFTTAPPTTSTALVVWKVWGTAPNRQLWIKWAGYKIGSPSVSSASFMCMLEEGTDKIYLVEGAFTVGATTLASTTTAGIQLNSTRGLMYSTLNRPRVANAAGPTDNNVLTFAPYAKAAMTFSAVTTSQPNISNIAKNAVNEAIMRIDIDMNGELTPLNLTQIALNTAGTTTNADITNARVFYGGNDSNFSTATQFGSTATSPSGVFTITGTQALKMGRNYLWVTYSLNNSATANNVVDVVCSSVTIGGVSNVPTVTVPVGSRTIKAALSGTVSVGTGNTYIYLSDVFKEINANGLSGNTILSITSDINDTAVASLSYSGAYSIRIVPSAEVFRNLTARFPTTYIELSGAKNVTFDGKGPVSGSGRYLRFINKDSTGSTFNLINGSRFDTIRSCVVEGAINSLTKGMIHLGTSVSTATGIRDIQIINNDLRDRSDSTSIPAIMIFSAGTTDLPNGNITISNNNIFNFRRSAIYINTGNVNDGNYTISGNSMYYNASTAPANGDVVPIMFIPGTYSDNNLISGNYIGGQSPLCAGSAWVAPNSVNFVAMNINAGLSAGTSIQGNTIQNINVTGTSTTLDFAGIRLESGKMNVGTVTGNTIGHPTNVNSITNTMRLTLCIYSIYGAGDFNIANNTIANINHTGTATTGGVRGICIQAGGAKPSIYNNTIYNLTTACGQTTASTSAMMGIGMNSSSEVGPILIQNNKIYGLSATHATAAVVPSGIIIDNSTNDGIVQGNKVYDITCVSSHASASVHGIYIQGGTKNWAIQNNTVSLTNGANTVGMTIRGISDNATGNTNKYYNNTVYIGGTATSGTLPSYAFERRTTSVCSVRNNILYNERTGGTGIHAAIANVATTPATNWDANTSGYNLLVSQSSASIGYWGTSAQTFAQLQASSGGDKTSWSDTSAKVVSGSFFKSLATGDLSIDSSNALCWYANGKGIALSGQTTDIHGQSRSVTIATGAVDIGADEFPTTTLPPNATVTGNILTGDTSKFVFAGRTIARVYWNTGVYPTSLNLRYYTGTNPPSAGAQKYFNSYYQFAPAGAGIFDASVELFYDSALFGKVSTSANIRMANYVSVWNYNNSTILDAANVSYRANSLAALNIFTGTDVSFPLPVKLVQFNGVTQSTDANLFWQSAAEINASTYTIERSFDAKQFEEAGSVNATGKAAKYTFVDQAVFEKHSLVYYRLKITDLDGKTEYSGIISLQYNKTEDLNATVYPNPYTSESNLSFMSDRVQNVTVTTIDIQGRVINTQTIRTQAGINMVPVSLQQQPNGIYFIQLTTANRSFQTKIVK